MDSQDATEKRIEEFVKMGFTNKEMADMLDISVTTLKRIRLSLGIRKKDVTSVVTDAELDECVMAYVQTNPTDGEVMLKGALESKGVYVTRERLQKAIKRVNPEGVEERKRTTLKRREYCVPGPNALWHIDGNHKLIRWRIVVHGGIDGYSRIPVFLKCSTTNTSEQVLKLFKEAVHEHGLPQRVRSDKGRENVLVCDYITQHALRGPGRGSFIAGRSVHNQRIERLWRDVYKSCLSTYYTLFYQLEDNGLLDICDEVDLFCLHYVLIPEINHRLNSFKETYIHHKIRTAGNKTPLQLWTASMCNGFPMISLMSMPLDEDETAADYGIDHLDEANEEDDAIIVNIPETNALSGNQLQELTANFTPNQKFRDANEACEYYKIVRDFVKALQ
ncbi:hypothetical protein BSL78_28964 [Apostichopus japonicus]|uniref:Integrase catalytic domain-containing protein n=1 Tax=Stichopus japonicus TaxID=307972 RepID=A0A2G8JEQ0_STIJA|nr:hypothetical protein BSL78_28964 [Apostichopus japonicus]